MKFNATVAQEVPSKEKIIIVQMDEYVAKLAMSATPNLKCNGYFVNEINPVHLMPGLYRVYMKAPLDKKSFKGDIMQMETLGDDNEIFDRSLSHINSFSQGIEYEYIAYTGPKTFDRSITSNYTPSQDLQSIRQLDRLINQSITFTGNIDKQKLRDENITSNYNSVQDYSVSFIKSRTVNLNLNIIDHTDYGTNNQIPKSITNTLALNQNIGKSYVHPENINSTISFNQTINSNIYNAESIDSTISFNQNLNNQAIFSKILSDPYNPVQIIQDDFVDVESISSTPISFNQTIAPKLILSRTIISSYVPSQTIAETFKDIELINESIAFVSTVNYNFTDNESISSTPIAFVQTIAPRFLATRSIASTPLNFVETISAIHVIVATVTSTYVPMQTINKSYIAPRSVASTPLGFTGTQVIRLNIIDLEAVTSIFTPTQPANIVKTFIAGTRILDEAGSRILDEAGNSILQE